MKSQETKNKFVELRAKGLSFDKISKQLNVSKPVLIGWSRELSLEVANAKSLELDLLQEKYALSVKDRLQNFGEMQKKLIAEFKTRNISDLPTDKLADLILKVSVAIARENLPVQFQTEEIRTLEDDLKDSVWEKSVVSSWQA